MIYEVWYKDGIDVDYFGSREAAEVFLKKYIAKRNDLDPRPEGPWTEEDFEIREKDKPVNNRGVIIPGCGWPEPGHDYDIGG